MILQRIDAKHLAKVIWNSHKPALLGLLVVLCYQFYWYGWDLSFIPGDLGDSRFNMYLLEHGYKYLTFQTPTLWTAPFMYPENEVITYSDNLLGTVPFYAIPRVLGIGREMSFQLWVIGMALLNFVCAYAFLNWKVKNAVAAMFGALIFACSLSLVSQFAHAQTFPRFPIPLAFWVLFLYIEKPSSKKFFALIMLVVYQFYCAIYLGFMLGICIGVFGLVAVVLQRKIIFGHLKNVRHVFGHVVGLITASLLFLPLIFPYLRRSEQIGDKPLEEVLHTIPTWRSYFSISDGSWWHQIIGSTQQIAKWDHWIFPGMLALTGLVFLVIWSLQKVDNKQAKNVRWLTLIGVFMVFMLYLRVDDWSLFVELRKLPGLGGLRSITRIINVQVLFFGLGFALLVAAVVKKFAKRQMILPLVLLGLFILDNQMNTSKVSRYEKAITVKRTESLLAKMKHLPKGSIISYQPDSLITHPVDYQLDAMLASQSLDLKCVNGYSSIAPDGFSSYWLEPNTKNLEYWYWNKGKIPEGYIIVK